MSSKPNSQIALLCHPYLFALKEGNKIRDNLMDYSLLLLQRNCTEVIKSPSTKRHGFSRIVAPPPGCWEEKSF